MVRTVAARRKLRNARPRIGRIPKLNDRDISFRHLKVLSLLLEVQSLTRAAEILNSNQPTVSKILGKLRAHFDDPLFVRVGLAMHPTPKALEIVEPLRALLEVSESLRAPSSKFDPRSSNREFKVLVTEGGMIRLLPPLMHDFQLAGRGLRLKALPFDSREFAAKLETGEADVALGAFPGALGTLKHQKLYSDSYVSIVRTDHPRLALLSKAESFWQERHIVVTSSSTGHAAHQLLEQILLSKLAPSQIQISIPSFVTCAFVASRTDAIGTIPKRLATFLAPDLPLAIFAPPLALPGIDIEQFWHERVSRDPGHRWLRSRIYALFGQQIAKRSRAPGATHKKPPV
jgi:DNA-binding transcriptional LysR family regulator